MPVARGTEVNLTRSLLFAVVSLALGIGLVVLVINLAGSGGIDVKLGDDVFDAGPAADRADEIAADGPILFSSLSRGRPIFLQHIGTDPTTGWFAIDARSPTQPQECTLIWDSDRALFVDDCDPDATFPPDGTGLLRYQVEVGADRAVTVDLSGGNID